MLILTERNWRRHRYLCRILYPCTNRPAPLDTLALSRWRKNREPRNSQV